MSEINFVKKSGNIGPVLLSVLANNFKTEAPYITALNGESMTVFVALSTPEEMGFKFAKAILEHKFERATLNLDLDANDLCKVVFAIQNRTWKLTKFKSTHEYCFKQLDVMVENPDEIGQIYKRFAAISAGKSLCKELAESPSNHIFPASFADVCKSLAQYGVEVEILGIEEIKRLKMGALLAVAQGSNKEPKVVVLRYNGAPGKSDSIAFIGKGVCFDSGGLFIKDQVMMPKMKYDKSGAAAVVGGIMAVASQKLATNVIGVVGLVENMPDANAIKPSDIVTSMSGKTIEVADPDAEGRLVLADCIYYTEQKFHPSVIISLATLTADTIACLAHEYAGLFTRNDKLADRLFRAGVSSGDLLWRLPLGKAFLEMTKSDIADLKNVGIMYKGDNASAAEFLHNFVDSSDFAHLDISGMVWCDEPSLTKAKGATGYGVSFVEQLARVLHVS
jgi:leucyl aminopeptidase